MNSAISKVAGSAGRMTYKRSVVGQQMVERSLPRDANTVSQRASRVDFKKGIDGWRSLDKSAKDAWNFAAKGRRRRDDVTGEFYSLQGRQLYIGQASKLAQVSPGASLDILPSATPFTGDKILVGATGGSGAVTFTASGPNAADATTEFLAQRLPSVDRAPSPKAYVSLGFYKFAGTGSSSIQFGLGPGVWSVGYRFCCPGTGEETEAVELGTLVLGLTVMSGGQDEAGAASDAQKAA